MQNQKILDAIAPPYCGRRINSMNGRYAIHCGPDWRRCDNCETFGVRLTDVAYHYQEGGSADWRVCLGWNLMLASLCAVAVHSERIRILGQLNELSVYVKART